MNIMNHATPNFYGAQPPLPTGPPPLDQTMLPYMQTPAMNPGYPAAVPANSAMYPSVATNIPMDMGYYPNMAAYQQIPSQPLPPGLDPSIPSSTLSSPAIPTPPPPPAKPEAPPPPPPSTTFKPTAYQPTKGKLKFELKARAPGDTVFGKVAPTLNATALKKAAELRQAAVSQKKPKEEEKDTATGPSSGASTPTLSIHTSNLPKDDTPTPVTPISLSKDVSNINKLRSGSINSTVSPLKEKHSKSSEPEQKPNTADSLTTLDMSSANLPIDRCRECVTSIASSLTEKPPTTAEPDQQPNTPSEMSSVSLPTDLENYYARPAPPKLERHSSVTEPQRVPEATTETRARSVSPKTTRLPSPSTETPKVEEGVRISHESVSHQSHHATKEKFDDKPLNGISRRPSIAMSQSSLSEKQIPPVEKSHHIVESEVGRCLEVDLLANSGILFLIQDLGLGLVLTVHTAEVDLGLVHVAFHTHGHGHDHVLKREAADVGHGRGLDRMNGGKLASGLGRNRGRSRERTTAGRLKAAEVDLEVWNLGIQVIEVEAGLQAVKPTKSFNSANLPRPLVEVLTSGKTTPPKPASEVTASPRSSIDVLDLSPPRVSYRKKSVSPPRPKSPRVSVIQIHEVPSDRAPRKRDRSQESRRSTESVGRKRKVENALKVNTKKQKVVDSPKSSSKSAKSSGTKGNQKKVLSKSASRASWEYTDSEDEDEMLETPTLPPVDRHLVSSGSSATTGPLDENTEPGPSISTPKPNTTDICPVGSSPPPPPSSDQKGVQGDSGYASESHTPTGDRPTEAPVLKDIPKAPVLTEVTGGAATEATESLSEDVDDMAVDLSKAEEAPDKAEEVESKPEVAEAKAAPVYDKPLAQMVDWIKTRQRVEISVRFKPNAAKPIRSTLTGRITAINNRFDLLMKDVEEVYSAKEWYEEEIAVDNPDAVLPAKDLDLKVEDLDDFDDFDALGLIDEFFDKPTPPQVENSNAAASAAGTFTAEMMAVEVPPKTIVKKELKWRMVEKRRTFSAVWISGSVIQQPVRAV
ncbi:hypothetical protein HDV05_002546 [Chytridiales sp. JEL 0842]|nr:hypothetical protein HDV05_002546 [Chytridiales sp. JEL 0842]